jgi:DNA repair exonuclease SbcCD ATPase subunit
MTRVKNLKNFSRRRKDWRNRVNRSKRTLPLPMLSEARDSWVTIAQKKNELNEIIIPDTFSIDQDRRIEELQEKKREINKELKRLIEKYDDLNLQIEQIISNEAILSKESEIIQINRLYQQYVADIGKLPPSGQNYPGKGVIWTSLSKVSAHSGLKGNWIPSFLLLR